MITVFTPAYNRANLLPRLYESLFKQTFKDFEWRCWFPMGLGYREGDFIHDKYEYDPAYDKDKFCRPVFGNQQN